VVFSPLSFTFGWPKCHHYVSWVCTRAIKRNRIDLTCLNGRAMAQAVSRRPLTAEAHVRSRVSPCEICVGQSGTGTGFSPSTSVFPCQFLSIGAPLHGKTEKKSNHLHHRVAK
jgi:hypothetical protein